MLYLLRTPEIILTGVELVLFHPVVGAQTVRHTVEKKYLRMSRCLLCNFLEKMCFLITLLITQLTVGVFCYFSCQFVLNQSFITTMSCVL